MSSGKQCALNFRVIVKSDYNNAIFDVILIAISLKSKRSSSSQLCHSRKKQETVLQRQTATAHVGSASCRGLSDRKNHLYCLWQRAKARLSPVQRLATADASRTVVAGRSRLPGATQAAHPPLYTCQKVPSSKALSVRPSITLFDHSRQMKKKNSHLK